MESMQLSQRMLGLKPYILIEFDPQSAEFDEDDGPAGLNMSVEFGGGITEDDYRDFLEIVAASIPVTEENK